MITKFLWVCLTEIPETFGVSCTDFFEGSLAGLQGFSKEFDRFWRVAFRVGAPLVWDLLSHSWRIMGLSNDISNLTGAIVNFEHTCRITFYASY